MKKALAIFMVLGLVSVSIFAADPTPATVTFGGWGRLGYVFASQTDVSGSKALTSTAPTWAGTAPTFGRVGFNVNGKSDNVGFALNIDSNGNTLGVGDQAKIWVKINDMFKVEMGKVQVDTLRGKIGDSGASEVNSFGGEDAIFARFYPGEGVAFEVTPADGVFIGAALDSGKKDDDGLMTAAAAFNAIQIGAGYTIKDIGLIRAQYIGGSNKATAKIIQAAFAYTGMAGLVVDAGITYNTNSDVKQKNSFVVGANYGKDAISSTTRVAVAFGDDGANKDTNFGIYENASYNLAAPTSVGAEVSYSMVKDANVAQVFPYVKLSYGQGYLKTGLKYTMDMTTDAKVNTWAIPLFAEYSF